MTRHRRAPLESGSRRRSRLRAAFLGSLCAGFLLWSAPALAVTHPFLGQLTPAGSPVAVDDLSGDTLVAGSSAGVRVVRVYDSSAKLIATWSGSGTPAGSFGSLGVSVAANNATGDVYVGDGEHEVVDVLDSTGAYLGKLTGEPEERLRPEFVAVDQATGDVYVNSGREIYVFNSSGVYQSRLIPPEGKSFSNTPHSIAVDDVSGKVLVGNDEIINEHSFDVIYVFDAATGVYETTWLGSAATNPPGTPVGSFEDSVFRIAADNSTGNVYVTVHERIGIGDEFWVVEELDSAGRFLGQIVGTPSGPFGKLDEIAVGQATGDIYVTDIELDVIDIFGPPLPPTTPTVHSESVTNLSSDSARLLAQVNPGQNDTTYHFEYGTDASYSLGRVPASDADLGSGTGDLTASAQLSGLQPGTTYHFRVVATNALGTTDGPDHIFTTLLPAAPFALPDGRAYEMVTPPDKSGGEVNIYLGSINGVQAASNGDEMTYQAPTAFPGSPSGLPGQYVASRGPGDWSSQNLIPPSHTIEIGSCLVFYYAFSTDLARGVLKDGASGGANCKDEPPLVEGEAQNTTNLFLRDTTSGSYSLLNVPAPGFTAGDAAFAGATPDLSHVLFSSTAPYVEDATASNGQNLYESFNGVVTLVSRLPDGTGFSVQYPGDGRNPGELDSHYVGSISEDGSRVFWTGGEPRDLYLREGIGTLAEHTVQLDASQGPGPGGGGHFMIANSDGSKAFFTADAAAGLTNDTVSGSGANLYRYDAPAGTLTDLTPAKDAEVLGVVALSRDGSYLYFVAKGALAAGASRGQPNLYIDHEGTLTYIATLSPSDSKNWSATPSRGARVTSDGTHLAFDSLLSLTRNDNRDVNTGKPDNEIYLYDAATSQLRCASCNPSGAAPIGPSDFNSVAPTQNEQPWYSFYTPRNLSEDGSRLFFDSADSLVAGDTNHQRDVYEWERGGAGSCTNEGSCVSLISTGTSESYSAFFDASASGDNVFFLTAQRLLSQDGDSSFDIYDARVCTSADPCIPPPSPPAPPCSGESCRAPLSAPPSASIAGSITFFGPGNLSSSGSMSASGATAARILNRVVHGSTFLLSVELPAKGTITIAGGAIRTARRMVAGSGTYRLRVTLTSKARLALRRKHKLKLKLRVAYASASPRSSSITIVALTITA
jgi:hypothetical protein